ncbi:MAG: uroporphyrinogen-III synthase [Gammaproteobacteria bacterium]|nr:uroporphyrinogen-III synthase [Gammaproteobacteria bacterium]
MTRTEPGAGRLSRRLTGAGHAVLNAPVLHIEDTSNAAPPGCFDFVLFVSGHAVERAFATGWDPKLRPGIAAGIGAAAETALRSRGIRTRLCGIADATAVTRALMTPPPRTLLVKGEGGRDVVQNWVRSHGASVAEWDVYRRVPARPTLGDERIDAIVAASGDGVREIAALWFAGGRSGSVPLLVPSPRVADLAEAVGFDNVVVTAGAADDAVVSALRKLREV